MSGNLELDTLKQEVAAAAIEVVAILKDHAATMHKAGPPYRYG